MDEFPQIIEVTGQAVFPPVFLRGGGIAEHGPKVAELPRRPNADAASFIAEALLDRARLGSEPGKGKGFEVCWRAGFDRLSLSGYW